MLATILALLIATASADCPLDNDKPDSTDFGVVTIDNRNYNLINPMDRAEIAVIMYDCGEIPAYEAAQSWRLFANPTNQRRMRMMQARATIDYTIATREKPAT
jgi:hypothetical protein